MALITYSPWQDAANYGRGLGDTLGQILLQVPRIRAQQKMQGAEFQNEQSNWPLQHQLLQAQVGEAQQRPQLEQAKLAIQQLLAQRRGDSQAITDDYHKAETDKIRNETQGTKPLTFGQGESADKLTEGLIQGKEGQLIHGKPKAPINVSPEVFSAVRDAVVGALKNGQSGQAAGVGMLQNAQLQPNLQTNQVPQVNPGGMLPTWLGGQGPTTNMIPQVTTNSYQMHMPQQQSLQQQTQGQQPQAKQLDSQTAQHFLQQAQGNKDLARQLARQAGYNF